MKKALLSLLLVAAFMPFTMAQSNDNLTVNTVNATACETYTWNVNGQTYIASTVATYLNATSDTLFVLNLTINNRYIGTETVNSDRCTYTWHGNTYHVTGLYTDTIAGNEAAGICDSIYNLQLTVSGIEVDSETISTCGEYEWHDNTYTTSGVYTDTTYRINSTDLSACAHVDLLNLSIVSTMNADVNVEHCGDYTWNDSLYTVSGLYTYTTHDSVTGCDTLYTLHLSIVVDTANQESDSACASKTWRGTSYTTSGIYSVLDTNATTHCVTYRSIALKIKQPRVSVKDTAVTGCNNILFNVSNFSGSTTKKFSESQHFDTMIYDHRWAKCYDSTINVNVTIHKSGYDTTYFTACDSFYWSMNKKTYYKTPATAPSQAFAADTFGCDSMMTLMLTIQKSPVISAINGEWNLNAGDTAVLYPTCTEGAAYKWTYGGLTSTADTLIIPNVQGNIDVALEATYDYPADGFACHDTSWITIVTFVGINGVQGTNVSLYPNPTVGQLNVESDQNITEVAIFNTLGQQVLVNSNLGNKSLMNLSNLSKGAYTMRVSLQNGETIVRKFIITK